MCPAGVSNLHFDAFTPGNFSQVETAKTVINCYYMTTCLGDFRWYSPVLSLAIYIDSDKKVDVL